MAYQAMIESWLPRLRDMVLFGLLLVALAVHPSNAADLSNSRLMANAGLARLLETSRHTLLVRTARTDHASDNAAELAEQCLAAMALVREKQIDLLPYAEAAARSLVRVAAQFGSTNTGWGISRGRYDKACNGPGTFDAFSNGTCNPAGTVYTYQTGLAVTCLAQVYIADHDKALLQAAEAAIAASWTQGRHPPSCPDCFYYWYSYSQNDEDRYVRNTNALIGMSLAWAWRATGRTDYKVRAMEIGRAEVREMKQGNNGYYGVDDPLFLHNPSIYRSYIENHVALTIRADADIAATLGFKQLAELLPKYWAAWQECRAGRCVGRGCDDWGAPPICQNSYTFTACILRHWWSDANTACSTAVKIAIASPKPKISNFATWTIFGLPAVQPL